MPDNAGILLITGSRETTEEMEKNARAAVRRAALRGMSVYVGDARGIDTVVIDACHFLGVDHTVHGAYNKIRYAAPSSRTFALAGDYLERDRYMAERCDYCYAIWNSKSHGTLYTYNHALRNGKVPGESAWIKMFTLPKK